MLVAGRDFSEQLIERIRVRVRDDPTLTRTALSREVCGWLDWRGADGRVKDMSCRAALLKLARRRVIALPQAQRVSFVRRAAPQGCSDSAGPVVEMSLAELGAVTLVPVDAADAALSKQWWAMMRAHHPLGAGPLCGAQLRYLLASRAGFLGGLSFSAPAWRLEARDRWIGWDESDRRAGLAMVVANSRFLIVPTVKVPNLASHVLSLALGRVAGDWHRRYGVTPVLVETFVDAVRWRGTCYKAANWVYLGKTQGRGRQDRGHRAAGTRKDIWVYPLRPDW